MATKKPASGDRPRPARRPPPTASRAPRPGRATPPPPAEPERRESEERFQALVEQSLTGIVIIQDERFVYANPRMAEMIGYELREMIGLSPIDLVVEADRTRVRDSLRRRLAGEEITAHHSFRARHRSGAVVELELFARTITFGGRRATLGTLLDITERRRAEEALRASEERYRTVVETAYEGILAMNAAQRVTFVNPRASELLGYARDEMLDRAAADFLFPEDLADHEARLRARRAGEAGAYERRFRRKDGSEVWTFLTARALRAKDGAFDGSIALITDITERRRLEEQFRQAQKMEAVGLLAGGIAHDFNNVLTIILGHCESSRLHLAADDPTRSDLVEIERAAERAARLVRHLLAFGRRQVLQPCRVDLNAVLTQLTTMLKRVLGGHIHLVARLDPALAPVVADPVQIEQVIMNLAINARDAMPRGGTLTIGSRNVELDAAYCRRRLEARPGPHVLLTVDDTGVGMDEATRRRLFEPFFTTKPRGQGTGLGLATVYGIVQQSGGHIDVASEPGRGASFRIYLPRAAEPVVAAGRPAGSDGGPEREAGRARDGTAAADRTVLLVEDDDGVRGVVRDLLAAQGYTVLEARNGEEAIARAGGDGGGHAAGHGGGIDLLVTDVVMPGMNGRELAEELTRRLPHLRVLYLSGYARDVILPGGTPDPQVVLLEKPLNGARFLEMVREALGARGPAPAPAGSGCARPGAAGR